MGKRAKTDPSVLERKRAHRLRSKLRAGGEIVESDRAWLDEYTRTRTPAAHPAAVQVDADDVATPAPDDLATAPGDVVPSADEQPSDVSPPLADDSSALPPITEAAPPVAELPPIVPPVAPPPPPRAPKAPPLPSPPRIAAERGESASGKWQDKYRTKSAGREATVTLVASQIHAVNCAMVAQLKLAGVAPIIEPDHFYGALVLALDEVLPDQLEITPRVLAVGGTLAITTQRFLHRKKIGEQLAIEAGRAAQREGTRARTEAARERGAELRIVRDDSPPAAPEPAPAVVEVVPVAAPEVVPEPPIAPPAKRGRVKFDPDGVF